MRRTVIMLIEDHRIAANLASAALLSLVLALLAIGVNHQLLSAPSDASHPANILIGLFLGTTLIFSLLSMIIATFFIIKKRREVTDWGTFLVIIWAFPYIGISTYLGGVNLLVALRKEHKN